MSNVIQVPQDATLDELIDAAAKALPPPRVEREFRLAVAERLGGECPFVDVLEIAKAWGVTCVPGERSRP